MLLLDLDRALVSMAVGGCLTLSALAQGAGGQFTEEHAANFDFPLSPNQVVLELPQFDDESGTRILQTVTVGIDAAVGACVTSENDSPLDAPNFALNLSAFMTTSVRDISQFLTYDETFESGGVSASDGNRGEGPDFFDFGCVEATDSDEDVEAVHLAPYIGLGTINAEIFASGGFSIAGTTDSTTMIVDFMANGTVTIIYTYRLIPVGACCFEDGGCVEDFEVFCLAEGGIYQGDDTFCEDGTCPQPGACCLPDGTCFQETVLGSPACNDTGGDYQGDNTLCDLVECPQACCFDDGSCLFLTASACEAGGGDPRGEGTNCATVDCGTPGACCLPNGDCVMAQVLGGSDCLGQGGDYRGDNTSCDDVICPQPGACCLPDGTCVQSAIVGGSDCDGQYQGDDTNCDGLVCDPPVGACCFDDGTCTRTTQDDCNAEGGDYQGDLTKCGNIDCPDAKGACCLPDGSCAVLTELQCLSGSLTLKQHQSGGGIYQGDGTTCFNVDCPTPPGACCFDDGSCVELEQDECNQEGGIFQGASRVCEDVSCRQPEGACCFDNGSCTFVTEERCETSGGASWTANLSCAAADCPQPEGACCFENGSCEVLIQDACNNAGGLYQGNFSSCSSVECPQPTGACCFDDGSCSVASLAECVDGSGVYQGDLTSCADVDCPQPPGACCLEDGSCTFVTQGRCINSGGQYQGDSIACDDVECPQPAGACCHPDGSCSFVTQARCGDAGGVFQGAGIACADVSCPDPDGACCLADGACLLRTQLECFELGGVYQGDFTSCSTVDCTPPSGGCCFDDGSCVELTQSTCTASAGVYQGDGIGCDLVECPVPPGACCFPNGSCTVVTEDRCTDGGGEFQGVDVTCADANCPPPPGACCFEDGSCVDTTLAECLDAGGFYQGDLTTCNDVECPQPDGACCYPTGACAVLSAELCLTTGGIPQPAGSNCVDADCPPPPGACCLESGACEVTTAEACAAAGGLFQGAGTTCDQVTCAEGGACCLFSGACIETTEAECLNSLGATYNGDGTTCDDVACTGACCFPDGSCEQFNAPGCFSSGGVSFEGLGTDCADVECGQGACCLVDTSCSTGAFDCSGKVVRMTMIWGGTEPVRIKAYDGDTDDPLIADIDNIQPGDEVTVGPLDGPNDSYWEVFEAGTSNLIGLSKFHRSCSDNEMNGPEDCGNFEGNGKSNESGLINEWILEGLVDEQGNVLDCTSTANCVVVSVDDCLAQGGVFQGGGTTCDTVACIDPTGACCFENGCENLTRFCCESTGGLYQGDGTNCSTTKCFDCDGKIVEMTMIWGGSEPVRIIAYDGDVGSTVIADIDNIQPGDEVTVGPLDGPNDSYWEVFEAGTSNLIGESKFHRSCSDNEMNGPEDCGNFEGNGKSNESGLINEWILEGLVDETGAVLDCTVPSPTGACCLADGTCLDAVTLEECLVVGGLYQGDTTSCAANPCPDPTQASFILYNNPGDPRLLSAITPDGYVVDYYGQKDAQGFALALTAVRVESPDGDVTQVLMDDQMRPSQVAAFNGTTFKIFWDEGLINVISADGSIQASVEVDLPAPGTPFVPPFEPTGASAQVLTTVQRCGAPVTDAIVTMLVGVDQDPDAPSSLLYASHAGEGVYSVSVPTAPSPIGDDIESVCTTIAAVLGVACTFTQGLDPVTIGGICTTIGAAIDLLLGGPTGEGVAIIAACESAFGALKFYCATIGAGPNPDESIADVICNNIGDIVDSFIVDDLFLAPAACIPGHGFVAIPGEVAPATGPFPSFTIDSGGDVEIAMFSTDPVDPDPGEGYVATAQIVCAPPNTLVTITVVGTDGYVDSTQCTITGDGSCALGVPGAAEGVVDTITVEIEGGPSTQVVLVF